MGNSSLYIHKLTLELHNKTLSIFQFFFSSRKHTKIRYYFVWINHATYLLLIKSSLFSVLSCEYWELFKLNYIYICRKKNSFSVKYNLLIKFMCFVSKQEIVLLIESNISRVFFDDGLDWSCFNSNDQHTKMFNVKRARAIQSNGKTWYSTSWSFFFFVN